MKMKPDEVMEVQLPNSNTKVPVHLTDYNEFDVAAYVEGLPASKQKYHKFKTLSLENDRFRKKVLVEALTSPDYKNSEILNMVIECIGFYTDYVYVGDNRVLLRTILMDTDYKTYSTLSQGIAKDICNLIDNELEPSEDYPTTWKVVQKRTNKYNVYVLQGVRDNAKT